MDKNLGTDDIFRGVGRQDGEMWGRGGTEGWMGKRLRIMSPSQERKEFLGREMDYHKCNRRVEESKILERP